MWQDSRRIAKRILKWTAAIVAVTIVGFGVYVAYEIRQAEKNYVEAQRPKRQSGLEGITLHSSKRDVLLDKGLPAYAFEHGSTAPILSLDPAKWSLETDRTDGWAYTEKDDKLTFRVNFADDKQTVISVCSRLPDAHWSEPMMHIDIGANRTSIEERFGKPASVSTVKSGLSQIWNYPAYQVAFEIEKGQVVDLCVADHALRFADSHEASYEVLDPNAKADPLGIRTGKRVD